MTQALRNEPTASTPTYTTVDDVYNQLQEQNPGGVSTDGSPSKSEVEGVILTIEDIIDNHTGHAWRERTVTEEYPDPIQHTPNKERFYEYGLSHRAVKEPLDSGEGDNLEVWEGDSYNDYLSNRTEGRAEDYYINPSRGVLYVRTVLVRGPWVSRDLQDLVRITYRYGESSVPDAIQRATTLLTAASLTSGEIVSVGVPQGGDVDRVSLDGKASSWQTQASMALQPYIEVGLG